MRGYDVAQFGGRGNAFGGRAYTHTPMPAANILIDVNCILTSVRQSLHSDRDTARDLIDSAPNKYGSTRRQSWG